MKATPGKWILLVLAVSAGALLAQRFLPKPEAVVGAAAEVNPSRVWEARLPDLAGRLQPLNQWQGKVLVLNFWAPWCPPCRKEIPDFIRLQQRHGGAGLQFVGIALDEPDKVAAFIDENGVNYPNLLGEADAAALSAAAGNRLGGLPFTVVFDRRGNAVATFTGGVTEARLASVIEPLL